MGIIIFIIILKNQTIFLFVLSILLSPQLLKNNLPMYSIRPPLFQSTIYSSTSEAEELVYICRCSEHFCMKYKVLEMLPIKIFPEINFTKFFVKLISRKKCM